MSNVQRDGRDVARRAGPSAAVITLWRRSTFSSPMQRPVAVDVDEQSKISGNLIPQRLYST